MKRTKRALVSVNQNVFSFLFANRIIYRRQLLSVFSIILCWIESLLRRISRIDWDPIYCGAYKEVIPGEKASPFARKPNHNLIYLMRFAGVDKFCFDQIGDDWKTSFAIVSLVCNLHILPSISSTFVVHVKLQLTMRRRMKWYNRTEAK